MVDALPEVVLEPLVDHVRLVLEDGDDHGELLPQRAADASGL